MIPWTLTCDVTAQCTNILMDPASQIKEKIFVPQLGFELTPLEERSLQAYI